MNESNCKLLRVGVIVGIGIYRLLVSYGRVRSAGLHLYNTDFVGSTYVLEGEREEKKKKTVC